jgi:hypothetical protein
MNPCIAIATLNRQGFQTKLNKMLINSSERVKLTCLFADWTNSKTALLRRAQGKTHWRVAEDSKASTAVPPFSSGSRECHTEKIKW